MKFTECKQIKRGPTLDILDYRAEKDPAARYANKILLGEEMTEAYHPWISF